MSWNRRILPAQPTASETGQDVLQYKKFNGRVSSCYKKTRSCEGRV